MARTKPAEKSATPAPDVTARFAPLTENAISQQTDHGSYTRGRSYYRQGRIHDTVLRGDAIESLCDGSDYSPYRVTATLATADKGGGNPQSYLCTCPRGGFCKHIVAMLLTWIDNPDQFASRPTLADALAERSQHELVTLIERMVERHPELERLVDLPVPPEPGETGSPNKVTVDEMAVRKMVRTALNEFSPHDYGWGDSWGHNVQPPPELRSAADLGKRYVDTGQWANAVVVLSSLTGEVIEEADEYLFSYDEEGLAVGVINDADNGLAEALEAQSTLPEDQRLDSEMRQRLIRAIYDIWQYEVFQAGGMGLCDRGMEALVEQATGDERTLVEGWLREETGSEWGKRAATNVLVDLREAAGATDEELLAIFRDAGMWDDVAAMLVGMDRLDEVVVTARQHIRAAPHLINIANIMLARGGDAVSRAIALVDDFAWEVEGDNEHHDSILKNWLVAQYSAHGRPKDALKLAERQFNQQPHFRAYQAVQQAAELMGQPDGTWEALRPKLIEVMKSKEMWPLLVDIHLACGEVAGALDAFDRKNAQAQQRRGGVIMASGWAYTGGDQDVRLAGAAEREFPDRSLDIYRRLAQQAIDGRSRSSYQVASGHLRQVKDILNRLDRGDEWKALIKETRETNKRLRALRDELDKAGLV